MTLLRSGNPIETIFDLIGWKENNMSAALAFMLERSEQFLHCFVHDIAGYSVRPSQKPIVQIQTSRRAQGITDVEIIIADEVHLIIEAKRNSEVPSRSQLAKYAPILKTKHWRVGQLIAVTNATADYARVRLDPPIVDGVPIVHRSWRELKALAKRARLKETNTNKRLFDEFERYLGGLIGMETKYSNMVYVVSLANGNPNGWKLSWIDVVLKRRRYFYPVGKSGWPDPPNYIGFRYSGKLQSIHHVESYDIFEKPRTIFTEAADETWEPHYCLTLGPPIIPSREVRTGKQIYQSGRCWCMLDTLLTQPTISDALAATKKRLHA